MLREQLGLKTAGKGVPNFVEVDGGADGDILIRHTDIAVYVISKTVYLDIFESKKLLPLKRNPTFQAIAAQADLQWPVATARDSYTKTLKDALNGKCRKLATKLGL